MKKILFSITALCTIVLLWAAAPKPNDFKSRYNEAATAFGAKDFPTATTGFEKLIADAEDDPTAVLLVNAAKSVLPKCYFMMGGKAMQGVKYADAEKLLQKSADLAKKYGDQSQLARSNKWLAKLYQIEATTPFNNKDFTTSSSLLAKGFAADSTNLPVALKLAWSYGEMALNTGDAGNYTRQAKIFDALSKTTDSLKTDGGDSVKMTVAEKATKGLAYFREKMLNKLQSGNNFDGMTALADSLTACKLDSALVATLRAQAAAGARADSVAAAEAQARSAADSLSAAQPVDSVQRVTPTPTLQPNEQAADSLTRSDLPQTADIASDSLKIDAEKSAVSDGE